MNLNNALLLLLCGMTLNTSSGMAVEPQPAPAAQDLKLRISWGHRSRFAHRFFFRISGRDIDVLSAKPISLEPGDLSQDGTVKTTSGAGDIDALDLRLRFPKRDVLAITNVQSIWRYLLENSETSVVTRLTQDPAFRPDRRKITLQMNEEGSKGFSLTADQLIGHGAFWLSDLDVFVATGDPPQTFEQYQQTGVQGTRVLDQVDRGAEASLEQFTTLWQDLGSPAYQNPFAPEPGHIVCLTWDSAIHKFGIDRYAGVRNDLGNPDQFRCNLAFGPEPRPPARAWRSQVLTEGLPVITTEFEHDRVGCRIQQFAYPLHGPPAVRRGDIPMVLLQRISLTSLSGERRQVPLQLHLARLTGTRSISSELVEAGDALLCTSREGEGVFLTIQGGGIARHANNFEGTNNRCRIELTVNVPATGTRELVVKLPSPPVESSAADTLLNLSFLAAKSGTLKFWSDYLGQGARFTVPEEAVNTLFRANLWHALRLPRRHSMHPDGKVDLPYSNFAYGQQGTPWPVNQAVYVDYMLYDLRGYHSIAAEELRAIFANNQEPSGHVGGYANWGVYTPGMLYAIAQNFLLSKDRAQAETLLPPALRALDWCLAEMRLSDQKDSPAKGLVLAPLNDLSHEPRAWAFNQAYLFAGVELFGRALEEIGHPRAVECGQAARKLQRAIQLNFGRASMESPAVPLRDGSWSPYVPGDASTPRRLPEVWYPTDVDCGALHLSRLKALEPKSWLTTALLHDHEDNLFLHGWGMANEPVYNQHATAYLLRDEPKAAIRAFYSMTACAFSHSVFEPVEHRWGWGQYFGPPSTDGAWFDLYRHMLIRETDEGALLLLQAVPRAWLKPKNEIVVERAPTYYGPLSLRVQSAAETDEIEAVIDLEGRKQPAELLVRFRHPDQKPLRAVHVNGKVWRDFDPENEWVRIHHPKLQRYEIRTGFVP